MKHSNIYFDEPINRCHEVFGVSRSPFLGGDAPQEVAGILVGFSLGEEVLGMGNGVEKGYGKTLGLGVGLGGGGWHSW